MAGWRLSGVVVGLTLFAYSWPPLPDSYRRLVLGARRQAYLGGAAITN